jgi:Fur family zinc uptake transcriptional regulator
MLETAARACQLRGARFTALRRMTLAILIEADRPLGAYELMRRMEVRFGRRLQPASIYRLLNFLEGQQLVVRLESRSAYIAGMPPYSTYAMIFSCDLCGQTAEMKSSRLEEAIADSAASLGFKLDKRVLEFLGTCGRCVGREESLGAGTADDAPRIQANAGKRPHAAPVGT